MTGSGHEADQTIETTVEGSPFRARHSNTQRLMLLAGILTSLACFLGAGGLLFAKHLRERIPVVRTQQATKATFTPPATIVVSGSNAAAASPPSNAASSTTIATRTTLILRPTTVPATPATAAVVTAPSTTPTTVAPTFPQVDPQAKNFLVAAADNNACVDPGSPWADAADPDRPASDRSDSIMIIRVDPSTNRAAVLSFPRDLWVRIPGRGSQKINAAYRNRQPNRLIETIQQNFGVPVDYYVQVDFCAFKQIVEAVGGIDVPFAKPIRDQRVKLLISEPGCHHFNGDEALAYVRSRHLQQLNDKGKWPEDPTSDFGRIARQQDFLSRVLRRALDKGLLNPSVARGLLDTLLKGYVVTGEGMSFDDFLGFAGVLRNVDPSLIRRYTIKGQGRMIDGNAVVDWKPFINGREMREILAIFRGEAQLEATGSADAAQLAPPTPGSATGATTSATTGATVTQATAPEGEPADNSAKAYLPDDSIACPG